MQRMNKKKKKAKRGDAKANAVINLFYSKWGFACGYSNFDSKRVYTQKGEEKKMKEEWSYHKSR